jgi:hypothetical protein
MCDPNVAVCLRAGTELAFREEAKHDHLFGKLFPWLGLGKFGDKVARFRQISVDQPNVHHDALGFANGKIVSVTTLRPGQRATVVQLPVRVLTGPQLEEHRLPDSRIDGARIAIYQQ